MVVAYNCTRNDATGYSPYELLFGRRPRLPTDIAFGKRNVTICKSYPTYLKDPRNAMEQAYKVDAEKLGQSVQHGHEAYCKVTQCDYSYCMASFHHLAYSLMQPNCPGAWRLVVLTKTLVPRSHIPLQSNTPGLSEVCPIKLKNQLLSSMECKESEARIIVHYPI